jgi:hypothetical protein
MSGAFLALVVLIALGISGIGIALCLSRGRPVPIVLVFESIAIGLLVQELIGFAALRANHYSRVTVLVLSLLVIGASLAVWTTRVRDRAPAAPTSAVSPSWRLRAPWAGFVSLGLVGVVIVALLLRQGPSYFIFETGDMGEYVNDANILLNRHFLNGSFPHGFTLFLGGTHLLLGRAHTVAGLPALGILLLLGAVAYAHVSRLHPLAGLGVAALVAALPVTVWFSLFPVSEAMYAVLLIVALYFVSRARSETSYPYAVVAGLVVGVMLLVRGNAMLLAPILVVGLFASAAVDDEGTVRVQRVFTLVALLALSAAYAYDLRYLPVYFVQTQLDEVLPHHVFRVADSLHLFDISVELVLAVALAIAAVIGGTTLVTRYLRPKVVDRPLVFWRAAYGTAVVVTVLLLLVVHHAGLKDALIRWGPVLVLLTILGVAGVIVRPGRYLDGVNAWLLLLVVCTYSVLFAARVPMSKPHAYYLYYDRYLFSEVLPVALVFAAVGLHTVIEAYASVVRARIAARVAIVGVCVAAALALLPNLRETHRITRYPLFGDAYQTLDHLDALTRTNGVGAVVYSGPKTNPPDWFFPNTYRAFGLPLAQSFRRVLVGLPVNPFGRDPQFDPAGARTALQKLNIGTGYLIALRPPGGAPYANDSKTHYLGSVNYVSPTLARRAIRGPANWVLAPFVFDVYALS